MRLHDVHHREFFEENIPKNGILLNHGPLRPSWPRAWCPIAFWTSSWYRSWGHYPVQSPWDPPSPVTVKQTFLKKVAKYWPYLSQQTGRTVFPVRLMQTAWTILARLPLQELIMGNDPEFFRVIRTYRKWDTLASSVVTRCIWFISTQQLAMVLQNLSSAPKQLILRIRTSHSHLLPWKES